MKPYIMIFNKDEPEKALDFAAGAVFYSNREKTFYLRALDQNVPLLEGDILIRFESPDDPEQIEFYLVGKEYFSISEEETKEYVS